MTTPFILPFNGVTPRIGLLTGCADRVAVLGRTVIGARALLGAGVTIRADGEDVTIGDDFAFGARGLVHISGGQYETHIGHRVAAGRNAVIHACTVGDDCVIGDDCIILDGAVLGDGVVLMPGSVVFPRSVLEADTVYAGSPARPEGPADAALREGLRQVIVTAATTDRIPDPMGSVPGIFTARTARIDGRVEAATNASVFFGCDLTARGGVIRIGPRTNVQDNSILRADAQDLVIGADTTIGHNVQMTDCTIADGVLVGMGARLAPGTKVETDVLVAAGTVTEPGQVLTSGKLWGGNPARPIADMTEARRAVFTSTITHYCDYAAAFRAAQGD